VKISKKSGNPWAAVTIEDLEGSVEVLFFGETYLAYSTVLAEDAVVVLKGRMRRRDEALSVQAMELSLPDIVSTADGAPVAITIPESRCTQPLLERLVEVLRSHPGGNELHVHVRTRTGRTVVRAGDGLRIDRTSSLYGDLKALLGPNCLV